MMELPSVHISWAGQNRISVTPSGMSDVMCTNVLFKGF